MNAPGTSFAEGDSYGASTPASASVMVRKISFPHHTSAFGFAFSASRRATSPADLLDSMSVWIETVMPVRFVNSARMGRATGSSTLV